MRIYYAHPHEHEKSEPTRLIKDKVRNLGHEIMDPFFDFNGITKKESPKRTHLVWTEMAKNPEIYDVKEWLELSKAIVSNDLEWIDRADCIIALLDFQYASPIGTIMEIFYAGHSLRKPVHLLLLNAGEVRIIRHPWLMLFCNTISRTVEELLETLAVKPISDLEYREEWIW